MIGADMVLALIAACLVGMLLGWAMRPLDSASYDPDLIRDIRRKHEATAALLRKDVEMYRIEARQARIAAERAHSDALDAIADAARAGVQRDRAQVNLTAVCRVLCPRRGESPAAAARRLVAMAYRPGGEA